MKSIIKYLVILIVIIIIISFTGYNLETEPHNIETVNKNQVSECMDNNTFFPWYVNLTYGNSKAEYIITYSYNPEAYCAGSSVTFGSINVFKTNQSLKFPITETSIEIKNIELYINNHSYSYNSKTNLFNNTIGIVLWTMFSSGNLNVSISFNVVPVYNVYIYHFNGKEFHFNYNYTIKVIK